MLTEDARRDGAIKYGESLSSSSPKTSEKLVGDVRGNDDENNNDSDDDKNNNDHDNVNDIGLTSSRSPPKPCLPISFTVFTTVSCIRIIYIKLVYFTRYYERIIWNTQLSCFVISLTVLTESQ